MSEHSYTGIYLDKTTDRWRGKVKVEGRIQYIGSHATPEEAAKAIDM